MLSWYKVSKDYYRSQTIYGCYCLIKFQHDWDAVLDNYNKQDVIKYDCLNLKEARKLCQEHYNEMRQPK